MKNTRPLYEKFEKNYFVPIAIVNVFMPTLGSSPYKKPKSGTAVTYHYAVKNKL